jgi:hypothetical protein
MSLRKKVHLIIYRFREQGLEVFLTPDQREQGLSFLEGEMADNEAQQQFIELDAVAGDQEGRLEEAVAVEGDWHEIPSLKAMLQEDAYQLKEKLKSVENGAFLSIKDALKSALPHQYAFLKELRDILTDRNSLRDL